MPDMGAIAGMMSALNAAFNITKAMIGLRDAHIIQEKVIELQRSILEAQNSAFTAQNERAALVERIRAFEEEVASLKAWDAEKERYELKDVGSPGVSVFAYAVKPEAHGPEPFHLLCVKCYENHKKGYLQAMQRLEMRRRVYQCSECKSEVAFSFIPPDQPSPAAPPEDPLRDF
jgi:hypothetical protein